MPAPETTGPKEYSSLREAVGRILGATPGGSVLGLAGSAPQQSEFVLGQKKNLGTTAGASNTPFTSPQDQALIDAKAATAAAQERLNPTTPVLTGNPWDKPAATASINKGFFYDPGTGQIQVGGMWGAPDKMTVVNPQNINDPGIYHTMDWAIGERNKTGFNAASKDPATLAAMKLYEMASPAAKQQAFNEYGKYYYSAPGAYEAGGKPAAAGGQSAAMAATEQRIGSLPSSAGGAPPTRPMGGVMGHQNVSWQEDQAYWRALDAYNKANKLGAYR